MAVMTNKEFVAKLKDAATNHKTLYVMGCFGAPMTAANKKRYTTNHEYNKQASRTAMINAASADTFGFDCVCLIKGILWGWNGDASKTYGGAGYAVNGVPDIGADTMITKCSGVSTDFSKIEVGEALWLSGHIGVYIGDGLAVECTPAFANKVQITAVKNIGTKSGYNSRTWTKHGKLPYITYEAAATTTTTGTTATTASGTLDDYAEDEIVNFAGGKHYTNANAASGTTVKASLAKVTSKYKSGKHPLHLRAVNESGAYVSGGVYGWVDLATVSKRTAAKKTVDEIAREVIRGLWGNGTDRKNRLTAAGYDYDAVQKRVNELLK